MQTLKKWLLRASSVAPERPRSGVRILLFHEIKDSQFGTFEALIRFIQERYGLISPDSYDRSTQTNGVRYIISFDDGFVSQLEATREVLDPSGIKALFFVCPSFVNLQGTEAFDFITGPMNRSDVLRMKPELRPLSWDDLNALSSRGHEIGSHSMNHLKLSEVRDEGNLVEEILSSGDELGKNLGRGIDWFAYPFGGIDSIHPRSLSMIGRRYRYCCSGLRGINTGTTHRLCLTRECIDLDHPIDHLKRIAAGGLDFFYYFKQRKLLKMANAGDHGFDER